MSCVTSIIDVPAGVLIAMCTQWLDIRDITSLRLTCCALAGVIPIHVAETKAPLRDLCLHGKLKALRGMHVSEVAIRDEQCLGDAAEGGQLEVARYLTQRFQLQIRDARANCGYALVTACANGHLDMVRWLVHTFQLTASDLLIRDAAALRQACKGGHMAIAQWLAEHFHVVEHGLLADRVKGELFRTACYGGFLELSQWCARHFSITVRQVRFLREGAIGSVCYHGKVEIGTWLVSHFKLTKMMLLLLVRDGFSLGLALRRGHMEAAKWLIVASGISGDGLEGAFEQNEIEARHRRMIRRAVARGTGAVAATRAAGKRANE